jgi:uncharacterized protein with PIN domain
MKAAASLRRLDKSMNHASFRFYADLSYFLPHGNPQRIIEYAFRGEPAVKDAVEALGVPHTEVGLILVNGRREGFDYHLREGDRVSVFPVFRYLTLSPSLRLQEPISYPPRFVLDIHLGRLAAYLRLLGFDAHYRNDFQDGQLAHIASTQDRILLTRDRGLLKRNEVRSGYCLRSTQPREQALEVLQRYRLGDWIRPFERCMRCNGLLVPARKREVQSELPASVREGQHEFRRCSKCGQVYWRGSHYDRLLGFIEALRSAPGVD